MSNFIANAIAETWGGFFSLICLITSLITPFLGRRRRRLSVSLFALCAIAMFSDAIAGFFRGAPGATMHMVIIASNGINFCTLPILACIYCEFISISIHEKSKLIEIWKKVLPIISLAIVALVLTSQFTGIIYTVDDQNIYHRGPFMWIYQICSLLVIALTLILLFNYRKSVDRKRAVIILASTIPPFVGGVMLIFFYGFPWLHIAMMVTSLILFFSMLFDSMRDQINNAKELENSKSKLMISQIKPHFIYNSLNAIQYLCRTDPAAASQAIATFSKYLRSNIDTLDAANLIPFDKEIGYVEAYLNLEKLRFDDDLSIVWELDYTDFLIPPLSVQVLTENAVKHGIRKAGRPGCVTIRSFKSGDSAVIEVEDDGIGFDTEATLPDDGRSHVGLENVRKRIQSLSKGELNITSQPGAGTTARITLPA